MAKKSYRVEIVSEYESMEEAVKAAKRALKPGDHVTLYEQTSTASGQVYERTAVWANGTMTPTPKNRR